MKILGSNGYGCVVRLKIKTTNDRGSKHEQNQNQQRRKGKAVHQRGTNAIPSV